MTYRTYLTKNFILAFSWKSMYTFLEKKTCKKYLINLHFRENISENIWRNRKMEALPKNLLKVQICHKVWKNYKTEEEKFTCSLFLRKYLRQRKVFCGIVHFHQRYRNVSPVVKIPKKEAFLVITLVRGACTKYTSKNQLFFSCLTF